MAKNAAGRRPLTRESIVRAAITLIERDGAGALSMRKVAAELGVGTMSLYNHVPDRETLLEEVARTVLAGLDLPEDEAGPGQDWKLNARAMIGAFRGVARAYPRSMHLLLTSRLDLEFSWRAAERALGLLAAAGFDGETSVRALRALMSYAIGSQMMENGALKTPDQTPEAAFQTVQADPGRFPHVTALAPQLMQPDPEADFETGLEMLLSGLDRLLRTGS
ncbi:TetR/AcrR family transcriptional regulator [Actinocorallia populi]|uniref:TetR/AcrR family transcriptional regulator n=1 Tax=Actinocorallia populi TaxID=2079200 RepID=UPI000D097D40|nr:TetR/AcrR family transcriptional regulator C-terminal domain-containing protein [Actinocorallia populi]